LQSSKRGILTKIKEWLFLALTPLYLWIVFYKLSSGADLEGILTLSAIIFVLYLPIQIITAENELSLSFQEIFGHQAIRSLLYPLFGLLTLVGAFMLFEKYMVGSKEIGIGLFVALYGVWWYITNNLIDMLANGTETTKFKMISMLLFIISLIVMMKFPHLPSKIDAWYFLELAFSLLYIVMIGLAIVPKYGFKVLGKLYGSALKSTFGSKNKSSIDYDKVEAAAGGSMSILITMFLLYGMIFIPFISWLTSITDSWNSTAIAIFITVVTIVVSSFGAYFQVRLFISYFTQNQKKALRITIITLSIFYIAAIVNMGFIGTVDKSSRSIEFGQQKIHDFNENIKATQY